MTLAEFIAARARETYPEPITPGHAAITAEVLPEVCKRLPKDFAVLDVGCGQGVAFDGFYDAGARLVVGNTTNAEDFYQAQKVAAQNSDRIFAVYRFDMHEIGENFDPEGFDLVWARHVLEHSIAPFFVLSEFHRVLKPGGWMYCEVPAPDTSCQHETNQNHYSVLGHRAWTCLIERSGFELLESKVYTLKTPAGTDIYFSWLARKA